MTSSSMPWLRPSGSTRMKRSASPVRAGGRTSCAWTRSASARRDRGCSRCPASTRSSWRAPTWDAVSWNLNGRGSERLARTFEWLEDELPGEFTFEVLWGDEPIDKLVSREEFVRIVRTGRLGGRTRYRVMPS